MLHEQRIISMDDAPTLADLFNERCTRTPGETAYVQCVNGDWRRYSWEQTRATVARWQHAMLEDGLTPGERVALMCSNRWEWVLFDQAAQGLGLITVPIYTNDRPENIAWILQNSGAALLLLENAAQWRELSDRVLRLPRLRRTVCLERADHGPRSPLAIGDWLDRQRHDYHCRPGAPDSLATIVYTSGTTGRPKGVMLSHRNILFNIQAVLKLFKIYPNDLMLSFLPLSHALERTAGYYLAMTAGIGTAFNRSIALLAEDLQMVRPTILISVPRIFERVYTHIHEQLKVDAPHKRTLFNAAVDIGWQRFLFRQGRGRWRAGFLLQPLLDKLIGRRLRARLGGRLRFAVCGGAALPPDIARMFIGLGIPVVQGYGLTETAPVITANPLENNRPDSVGLPLPGVQVAIGDHQELLTRSPSVMLGYWKDQQATDAIIDGDGWLHTGDKVELAASGHLTIVGRLKDIIVLSNGEKIPPSDMESAIVLDELVDQVMVIGEGKPYLSALVVPNPEAFTRLARELHLDPANEETCCDENVRSILMQRLQQRTAAFPGYARIHELAVVREAWTPDNGLATPTLKLRRNHIYARYQHLAEKLYTGH